MDGVASIPGMILAKLIITIGLVLSFFETYNRSHGTEFKPTGRAGPKTAAKLIERGLDACRNKER